MVNIEKLNDYVELLFYTSSSLAIIIGGYWFLHSRKGTWNLDMVVSSKIIPYNPDNVILWLSISLKNIGDIRIKPSEEGCMISIKEIPQNLSIETRINYFDGYYECIESENILEKYKLPGKKLSDCYSIEPNCTYEENLGIIAKRDTNYIVQIKFFYWKNDDRITTYSIVNTNLR